MKSVLILALLVFTLSSCKDFEDSKDAEILSYDKLINTAGYGWFVSEKDSYTSDSQLLPDITSSFNSDEHSFLVFVNPSCSCTGTQKRFPHLVKILEDANIDIDKVTFYSMANEDYNHPHSDNITLNDLPTFITLKNGVPVYSILDSLDNVFNAEGNIYGIEVPLLESMKK